jgi:hypothetical protein
MCPGLYFVYIINIILLENNDTIMIDTKKIIYKYINIIIYDTP